MTQNHVWETGRATVRIAVWLFGGLDSSISLEERKCLRDPADAKPALRLLLPLTRPHPAVWLHVHASLDTARTCYDNILVVLCTVDVHFPATELTAFLMLPSEHPPECRECIPPPGILKFLSTYRREWDLGDRADPPLSMIHTGHLPVSNYDLIFFPHALQTWSRRPTRMHWGPCPIRPDVPGASRLGGVIAALFLWALHRRAVRHAVRFG